MAVHKFSKGLDLPITGQPVQQVKTEPRITRVAVVADDFPGMKPRMAVSVGDNVARGQLLFENRKVPGARHTAPASGTVVAVNRGARRALQTVVIELSASEQAGTPTDADFAPLTSFTGAAPDAMTGQQVTDLLVESGLWTALRTRPFGKTPVPGGMPAAIFVNAADTNPLAADPKVVIGPEQESFEAGLVAVSKLSSGATYLCTGAGSAISGGAANVQVEEFAGPHPSGTVGLHIHTLRPVSRAKTVWHIGYQEVIAIGKLVRTGKLDVTRVIALGGPPVKQPRLVRARVGANLEELTEGEFDTSAMRIVSGSVLSGKKAVGEIFGYLGSFHYQVSVLTEGNQRDLLGWLAPGGTKFSILPLFLSKFLGRKSFDFDTGTHGSPRAMVPLGMYEKVMPLDILPTFLLRALSVGDTERAEQLGALELEEEDLGLCTFVCPGKTNYGIILRENLQTIEDEG